MNKYEQIAFKVNEFLSREFSLDFTSQKSIIILIAALLAGVGFTVAFVIMVIKAQKIAKREGVSLFNIIHIVLFAIPVITIIFIPYLREHFALWCIISVISWLIPITVNIITIGKYAPLFIFLQMIFTFLICTVVGAIIAVIVMAFGLLIAGGMWADEYIDFYIYDSSGGVVGIKKIGKNEFIDTKGNCYTYTGYNNEFVDVQGNRYWMKK